MLFGFGPLLKICLLVINAIAVLSEDRFLAKSQLDNSLNCFLVYIDITW